MRIPVGSSKELEFSLGHETELLVVNFDEEGAVETIFLTDAEGKCKLTVSKDGDVCADRLPVGVCLVRWKL